MVKQFPLFLRREQSCGKFIQEDSGCQQRIVLRFVGENLLLQPVEHLTVAVIVQKVAVQFQLERAVAVALPRGQGLYEILVSVAEELLKPSGAVSIEKRLKKFKIGRAHV